MPHVMSLEGPPPSRLDQIRARLYGTAPKPMLRGALGASELLAPFKAHPLVLVLGVAAGLWYGAKKRR